MSVVPWGFPLKKHPDPAFEKQNTTKETILVKAAQEDPTAFGLLYQHYLNRVYRYVRIRVEQEEDAADLTQQIFLRAFNALPSYKERGTPFAAWLFTIARNLVSDMHRTTATRRPSLSWEALTQDEHPEVELDMIGHLVHQERLTRLRGLLAELEPSKRELLALRFAAGLSTPQIAKVVGKSPAAVKKQLTRILHTLKELYHE